MTDKLPDGNVQYKHGEQCQHGHLKRVCNECDLEASIAYWESRCRLAVEALDQIRSFMSNIIDPEYAADDVLRAIGPLPDKRP